jgi:dTDP-4-amino-4,6-dideoxygalactose transaminase
MNDITGAIGCSRLDRLGAETASRQAAAARYDAIVGSIDGLAAPKTTAGGTSVYHLYVVQMDPKKFTCTRDGFIKALAAEGVPTACTTRGPDASRRSGFVGEHPPVADGCRRRCLLLMHYNLSEEHFASSRGRGRWRGVQGLGTASEPAWR